MIRAYRILPLLALLWLALALPAPAQQDQATKLYVVTYVDVFPQGAADTNKWLREFAADSRKDPGSVRFEILRDVERTNHFTIVEVWQTRQAYEAHTALEHTKRFREKLQMYLGSPFDERLYHILE
ncbi:MAG TPA: antibiotic biosynthesis monooxygenase [Bryobacteraceae bacterium]|jgi:quinol monooxygenase YgiN|nr:antibiotic biosynthesis monooxygenase [Bryobacteraceae bacterium]